MLSTKTLLQRLINPVIIFSMVVFLVTWYDTTHAHILTSSINEWILQTLYVNPETTEKFQHYYYEFLRFCNVIGGNAFFIIIIAIIFSGLIYRKEFRIMGYCVAFIVVTVAIATLLKYGIDSPRPMFPLEHDSFPSGHAMRISIICAICWWLNYLHIYRARSAIAIVFIVPLLVGYARVGLGFHWVSDVLGSYAITIIVFSLVKIFYETTKMGLSQDRSQSNFLSS